LEVSRENYGEEQKRITDRNKINKGHQSSRHRKKKDDKEGGCMDNYHVT